MRERKRERERERMNERDGERKRDQEREGERERTRERERARERVRERERKRETLKNQLNRRQISFVEAQQFENHELSPVRLNGSRTHYCHIDTTAINTTARESQTQVLSDRMGHELSTVPYMNTRARLPRTQSCQIK